MKRFSFALCAMLAGGVASAKEAMRWYATNAFESSDCDHDPNVASRGDEILKVQIDGKEVAPQPLPLNINVSGECLVYDESHKDSLKIGIFDSEDGCKAAGQKTYEAAYIKVKSLCAEFCKKSGKSWKTAKENPNDPMNHGWYLPSSSFRNWSFVKEEKGACK